ncbi:hypothetical protein SAMN05878503_11043 [Cereibacter ovatus]|uniref:Uncharacterized protein n=1 Tax=Cereibacter ovatus TaxID=439529 RepID=A0A285CXB5_9RHOB|nr:ABC transporter related protein [Cereibacter ovatus]SNX71593.1 hypothetical protein SAMN05878503_11043 [Cereibacter ovatus]
MSTLITVQTSLPSRAAWAALRYADKWLADRLEPEEGQFFVTATGSELAQDEDLRQRFAGLIALAPGLCASLADRLGGAPLGRFDVLQLLILHDHLAAEITLDPGDDARQASRILAGMTG